LRAFRLESARGGEAGALPAVRSPPLRGPGRSTPDAGAAFGGEKRQVVEGGGDLTFASAVIFLPSMTRGATSSAMVSRKVTEVAAAVTWRFGFCVVTVAVIAS
jgi:hypothetical protein